MCSMLRNFFRFPIGIYPLGTTNILTVSIRRSSNEAPLPQNIIFDKVNSIITSKNFGQTFAVIHLYNRQYLIHLNDIIAIDFPIQADIGEQIKIEKCLLVGNENFTLVGRPVLNRDLVQVEATVLEKTMTQTYMDMFHIPRNHGFKRYRFRRQPLSMLRINEITVCHPLNTHQQQVN